MEPRRHTLLIVDDEADVLDSLRHLFRRRYRVLTATGGSRRRSGSWNGEPVQIILSDQRMPGMTGDVLLSRARRDHPEAIRLLFTGYADIQAVIHAVNEGRDLPIHPQALGRRGARRPSSARRPSNSTSSTERKRLIARDSGGQRPPDPGESSELAESMALKTAFLEVASHELNTPITIVLRGSANSCSLLDPHREKPRNARWSSELAGLVPASSVGSWRRYPDAHEVGRLSPSPSDANPSVPLASLLARRGIGQNPSRSSRLRVTRRSKLQIADDLGDFEIDAAKIGDVGPQPAHQRDQIHARTAAISPSRPCLGSAGSRR